MTEIGMGSAAQLLGVSVDTVRRWADAGRFPTERNAQDHRTVRGPALAAFARQLAESGGGHDPGAGHRSARNAFPGLVTKVEVGDVMAQVELVCGPFRVVSLMSSEAVRELGLEPGVLATATVKATNVVVETQP